MYVSGHLSELDLEMGEASRNFGPQWEEPWVCEAVAENDLSLDLKFFARRRTTSLKRFARSIWQEISRRNSLYSETIIYK